MGRMNASRLKAAWYVLTGRPVMFRMKAADGVIAYDCSRGALFLECSLHNMDLRQRGGRAPSAVGVRCADHRIEARRDEAGNLVCPMDGAVILEVSGLRCRQHPDDERGDEARESGRKHPVAARYGRQPPGNRCGGDGEDQPETCEQDNDKGLHGGTS
jgi:hypothetical protein